MAVCCGVLILMINFFSALSAACRTDFGGFARMTLITQLAMMVVPALLMTFLLTRSPRQTLLLQLAAMVRHSGGGAVGRGVAPGGRPAASPGDAALSGERERAAGAGKDARADSPGRFLAVGAADRPAAAPSARSLPSAASFSRAFGIWDTGGGPSSISALLFGLAHGILQQSLIATLVGVVLGYLAVQSGSILPGMVFHAAATTRWRWPRPGHAGDARPMAGGDRCSPCPATAAAWFAWPVVVGGAVLGLLLLVFVQPIPCPKSPEESLEEAIERGQSVMMVSSSKCDETLA